MASWFSRLFSSGRRSETQQPASAPGPTTMGGFSPMLRERAIMAALTDLGYEFEMEMGGNSMTLKVPVDKVLVRFITMPDDGVVIVSGTAAQVQGPTAEVHHKLLQLQRQLAMVPAPYFVTPEEQPQLVFSFQWPWEEAISYEQLTSRLRLVLDLAAGHLSTAFGDAFGDALVQAQRRNIPGTVQAHNNPEAAEILASQNPMIAPVATSPVTIDRVAATINEIGGAATVSGEVIDKPWPHYDDYRYEIRTGTAPNGTQCEVLQVRSRFQDPFGNIGIIIALATQAAEPVPGVGVALSEDNSAVLLSWNEDITAGLSDEQLQLAVFRMIKAVKSVEDRLIDRIQSFAQSQ